MKFNEQILKVKGDPGVLSSEKVSIDQATPEAFSLDLLKIIFYLL